MNLTDCETRSGIIRDYIGQITEIERIIQTTDRPIHFAMVYIENLPVDEAVRQVLADYAYGYAEDVHGKFRD